MLQCELLVLTHFSLISYSWYSISIFNMYVLSIIPLSWMNCQLIVHNKIHGNLEIRECAKKIVHELEAKNPTSYVLLSNVHMSYC